MHFDERNLVVINGYAYDTKFLWLIGEEQIFVPYVSTKNANMYVPKKVRHIGLCIPVLIDGIAKPFWYRDSTEDTGLVPKEVAPAIATDSNRLIPFDAATFDPKKFTITDNGTPVTISEGWKERVEAGVLFPIHIKYSNGVESAFMVDGRFNRSNPVTLFMEPIEPEGEEDYNYWFDEYGELNRKYKALEKERDKLKAQRDEARKLRNEFEQKLIRTLQRVEKGRDALREKGVYSDILAHIRGYSEYCLEYNDDASTAPPATIPFSWEKSQEPGYVKAFRNGELVKHPVHYMPELNQDKNIVSVMRGQLWQWTREGLANPGYENEYDIVLIPPALVEEVRYSQLTFQALRQANIKRLPQFKNKHGEPAHSHPEGRDWSPAQWLEAVVGELGEYANFHKKFVRGDISAEEFRKEGSKEIADVQIYLDILAFQNGWNLGTIVTNKFNEVSEKIGVDIKL